MAVGCLIVDLSVLLGYWGLPYWPVMVLLLGPGVGLGCGIMVSMSLTYCVAWASADDVGLVSTVGTTVGIGSVAINAIITRFVNPDNLLPSSKGHKDDKYFGESELLDRVPYLFLVLSGVFAAVHVIALMMLRDPSPGNDSPNTQNDVMTDKSFTINHTMYGRAEEDNPTGVFAKESRNLDTDWNINKETSLLLDAEGAQRNKTMVYVGTSSSDDEDVSNGDIRNTDQSGNARFQKAQNAGLKPTRKTDKERQEDENNENKSKWINIQKLYEVYSKKEFYVLCVTWGVAEIGYITQADIYKQFGAGFIHDDHFLSLVGTSFSVMTLVARPPWGVLSDRCTTKTLVVILQSAMILLTSNQCLTQFLNKWVYLLWNVAITSTAIGAYATVPVGIYRYFNKDDFMLVYGLVAAPGIFIAILYPVVSKSLLEALGFCGFFNCVSVTYLFALLMGLLLLPSKP
ncbi:uncharacterized protein LOC101855477 [Aplysia californica]|uniref:Uncharacterized protein LOC101855477 n=1 Tax=Aplysia californica TaxID=6500 RepID=A0ABM0JIS9_APLCA|nr:uncharacterized protein LOC101855477 [Aplysia californica]